MIRLCGCLLSVISLCETCEDVGKVIGCLEGANPKLVALVKLMEDEKTGFEILQEEFKSVIRDTAVNARRPFCNWLIDICRKRNSNSKERAQQLLYLGTLYGLYPGLHKRNAEEWSLDVRSLSIGAAHTALEEWMGSLAKIVEREEEEEEEVLLPELFLAQTGTGTHKFSQGLATSFAIHALSMHTNLLHSLGRVKRELVDQRGYSFMGTIKNTSINKMIVALQMSCSSSALKL